MSGCGRIVVICIGNEFRTDDGAGPAVLGLLKTMLPAGVELILGDGEPASLVEAWAGALLAIVVDAMSGGPAAPGTLHRIAVGDRTAGSPAAEIAQPELSRPEPGARSASSHGIGAGTAISLGRAVGRMPAELILHGIQACDVSYGAGLSEPVAARIGDLAAAVAADVWARLPRAASCQPGVRASG